MYKLKNLLLENAEDEILDYLKDCIQLKTPIYRGLKNSTLANGVYEIKTTRPDRILKDTPEMVNALIEGYLYYTGNSVIPNRRSSVFASLDKYTTLETYGVPRLFFPKKPSYMIFNKNCADSLDYYTNVTQLLPDGYLSNIHREVDNKKELGMFYNKLKEFPELENFIDNILQLNRNSNYNNELYNECKKINYDDLIKQIPQMTVWIKENLLSLIFRYINNGLNSITTFFNKFNKYLDEVEIIKNNSYDFPSTYGKEIEIISNCKEYIIISEKFFNDNFKWSDLEYKYVIKGKQ